MRLRRHAAATTRRCRTFNFVLRSGAPKTLALACCPDAGPNEDDGGDEGDLKRRASAHRGGLLEESRFIFPLPRHHPTRSIDRRKHFESLDYYFYYHDNYHNPP